MPEPNPVEIKVTREFQRKIKSLSKKYRYIQTDLQPILEKLRWGEILGDRIPGLKSIFISFALKIVTLKRVRVVVIV